MNFDEQHNIVIQVGDKKFSLSEADIDKKTKVEAITDFFKSLIPQAKTVPQLEKIEGLEKYDK